MHDNENDAFPPIQESFFICKHKEEQKNIWKNGIADIQIISVLEWKWIYDWNYFQHKEYIKDIQYLPRYRPQFQRFFVCRDSRSGELWKKGKQMEQDRTY